MIEKKKLKANIIKKINILEGILEALETDSIEKMAKAIGYSNRRSQLIELVRDINKGSFDYEGELYVRKRKSNR